MRKLLITLAVFVLAGGLVLAAGIAAEPATGVHAVTVESPCPVTACANGACHGFDDVPEPDGVAEMTCPEAGCASVECHAWDSLTTRYHQAIRREPEPVAARARGLGRGARADRAEGGVSHGQEKPRY